MNLLLLEGRLLFRSYAKEDFSSDPMQLAIFRSNATSNFQISLCLSLKSHAIFMEAAVFHHKLGSWLKDFTIIWRSSSYVSLIH